MENQDLHNEPDKDDFDVSSLEVKSDLRNFWVATKVIVNKPLYKKVVLDIMERAWNRFGPIDMSFY